MYDLYYRIRKAYKNWKRRRLRPAMYGFEANLRYQRGFRVTTLLLILTIACCLALIVLYYTGPIKPFVNQLFSISDDPIHLTPTPRVLTQTPGPTSAPDVRTATPTPDPLPEPTPSPVYLSWITPMPIYEDAEVVAMGISKYKLNVRTKPGGEDGEIIGILTQDQEVYILQEGTDWHSIVFAGGWGYAYAPYIQLYKEVELPVFPGLPQIE